MSDIREPEADAFLEVIGLVVAVGLNQADQPFRVLHRERRFCVGGRAVSLFLLRIFRVGGLNVRRVPQHDLRQVFRRGGREHRSPEAVAVKLRKHAAVIHMRVGQEHIPDILRLHGKRLVLEVVRPLLHTAVHQHINRFRTVHRMIQ